MSKRSKRVNNESLRRELLKGKLRNGEISDESRSWDRLLRKVVTYGLAGTLIAGGSIFAVEQAPFIIGTKPSYELEIVFLEHSLENSTISQPQLFLDEIDKAKEKGRPFKLLFIENVDQEKANYREMAIMLDHNLSEVKRRYTSLMSSGLSSDEAENRCNEELKTNMNGNTPFFCKIFTGAAIRGLKVLPIEAYSEEEHKMIVETQRRMDQIDMMRKEEYRRNAPLRELMLLEIAEHNSMLDAQKMRDRRIAKELEERFKDALDIFPELRPSFFGREELRAIGYMGLLHRPIYYLFDHSNRRLKLDEKELQVDYSITFKLSGDMEERPLTKREAYLLAIDNRWFVSMVYPLAKDNQTLVRDLVDRALKLSEADLVTLDNESSMIDDPTKRGLFVLNRIYGKEKFVLGF